MPSSPHRVTLSNEQWRSWNGRPIRRSQRSVACGGGAPVARHVDPVPLLVPGAHGLRGVGVGLGRDDVLVGVRLLDAVHHRVALERGDPPVVLVLVGQVDPITLLDDPPEQRPMGWQGGVDVECDARHAAITVGGCPVGLPRPARHAAPSPRGRGGLRADGGAQLADRGLADAAAPAPLRRQRDQLHRPDPRGPGRAPPHAGRVRPRPRRPVAELDREHPALGARAPHGRARPARLRAIAHARTRDLHLHVCGVVEQPAATSGSAPSLSSGTRWAASSAPSWRSATPSAWSA